jgi:hypothetical protein
MPGSNLLRAHRFALAVFAVFALVGCALGAPEPENPSDTQGSRIIEVDPEHQACERANDCVIIEVDCSGCGCGIAVNQNYQEFYRQKYEQVCSRYSGPVCETYCPQTTLTCKADVCEFEPIE